MAAPQKAVVVMDSNIEDLQARITFQEDLIQKLDEALGHQQQEIIELRRQIRLLSEQVAELAQDQPAPADDGPPPHY